MILRDGRKLQGVLRSYDQFGICTVSRSILVTLSDMLVAANLVLEDTVERIYHQNVFAEIKRGLFLIRGENVVLLGEIVRPHWYARLFANVCVAPLLRTWTRKTTYHSGK